MSAARLSAGRQVVLALFWFGISFVWGALLAVTLPFLLVPEHPGPGNPLLVSPAAKNTALAVLESGGLLVAVIVQPAAGAFSDRLRTRWGRRRPMIAVGATGAVACLLLVASATTFLFLVAVYCALQFCMNIAQGAYQGLLPDTVAAPQRGGASGFLGVATLSGLAIGGVAAGLLAPRAMCVLIAGVVAVTSALTLAGVAERPVGAGAEGEVLSRELLRRPLQALRGYFAEFARYPDFCWVVFSRFLIFTGLAGIQRFAANYIRDTFRGSHSLFGMDLGSAQTTTSVMLAVVIVCGLAVTYPAVRLSDRVGRRSILIAASVVGAGASVLFFFATSVTQVVLFALPAAVCFGMVVSVDWAFMADLAPRRRAGKFLGFSNLATAGAQAAAPAALGPVIDAVNARSVPAPGVPGSAGYRVLFAVAAVFFLLGGAVLRRVRTTRLDAADEELSAMPEAALAT